MWGKNQENQRPILFKEDNLKEEDEKTEEFNLNDLLDSYDVNKITEEQYDKARFLNNLDNIVNEEKGNNEEANDIVNQQGQNKTIKEENDSDLDEECYSEFLKIEQLRIEFENNLGLNLFKNVYRYISDEIYNKDIKTNEDIVEEKIKKFLEDKKYNEREIDLTIKKIPEIFSLILREKRIEQ